MRHQSKRNKGVSLLVCAMLSLGNAHCSQDVLEPSQENIDSFMQRLLRTADNLLAKKDVQNASLLYKKIIDQSDTESSYIFAVPALNGYGESLVDLNNPVEALEQFRESLTIQRYGNERAHFGMAKAYLALNRPDDAIVHYAHILENLPDHPEAYNGLGVAYDSKGLHEEAQLAYRKGLARAPADISLANNLGVSLMLSGRFDEAIATLKELSFDHKATPKIRQNLAFAYAFIGKMETAEQISRIDLDPQASKRNLAFFQQLRAAQQANLARQERRAKEKHQAGLAGDNKTRAQNALTLKTTPGQATSERGHRADMLLLEPSDTATATDGRQEEGRVDTDTMAMKEIPSSRSPSTRKDKRPPLDEDEARKQAILNAVRDKASQLEEEAAKNGLVGGVYTVQVGAYRFVKVANATADRLRREGYKPYLVVIKDRKGKQLHLLRLGAYDKTTDAIKTIEELYESLGVLGEIRLVDNTPPPS
ncbi:MAG: tetratricopeptide repeat protein [Alphaproteobacteria bacterium GM7ARS4]|nr:tetratricopeptide repeat protein [Alphaproteobacteria bacterium GM7ARS4]